MISQELKQKIFSIIPVSFECEDGHIFGIHKEYAPYAKVTDYLRDHPNDIYIALDFTNDEIYWDETPINYMFDYNSVKKPEDEPLEPIKELEQTVGTRNRCELNLHIYTTWQPNYYDIVGYMEQFLNRMQFWVTFDLEQLVDYTKVESIQDIDETTDRLMHRIVSCTFAYTNTIKRVISTVNTVEFDLTKNPDPHMTVHGIAEAYPKDELRQNEFII